MLRDGQADVEVKDNGRLIPLMRAARHSYIYSVKVLLRISKADVKAKDNDGMTAIDWAKQHRHNKIVKLLLKRDD
ncbi:hypothetical protein SVAN01_04958 [Stagonosporopsis vannaccii]|nr:hypothetical protein SVAN01_04958 [Stagonosporopsis vannaccii]